MTRIRIALAQMRCEKGDWEGNLRHTAQYLQQAREKHCDIVIFPEMSLSGYCDPTRFPESIQTLDSEWVGRFVDLTEEYAIAAAAGFIETNPNEEKPFITQVLAQNGRLVGSYRKRHIVDEEVEWFSPGDTTPVFRLQLAGGEVACALAICADSDNPTVFADAARSGAQIIFHSSAPGLYGRRTDDAAWQSGFDWYTKHLAERLPAYARRHGMYIAVATQTGSTVDEDFPGGSFVFGPDGECLAASPDYGEMLLICELDLTTRQTHEQDRLTTGQV
jgi:predicted amidohydrolase